MIQEEIFELDKKIKQITGILDRRKEKASEWNGNYRRILQEKHDKDAYLQKKCASNLINCQRDKSDKQDNKEEISRRCAQSRAKIQTFYNQLKELDILQKKKNKIRLLNMKQNIKTENTVAQKALEPKQKILDKIGNSQVQQTDLCARTLKDRHNPFLGCKADKFIDFYQQNKNNDEQLGLKIMRHFGVGAENTPIGPLLKKEEKRDESKTIKQSKKNINSSLRNTWYSKKFTSSFKQKQHWFKPSPSKNMFQERIKKIIKYHGQFWNQDFNIGQ